MDKVWDVDVGEDGNFGLLVSSRNGIGSRLEGLDVYAVD